MSDTKIEWTDKTWNPLTGCTKVSPGCDNCYAHTMHERFNGPGSFDTITLHPERLTQPLKWRKPAKVFVNSMSDLFHKDVPDQYIADVFTVMAVADRHTFQVLTKRPSRMRSLLSSPRWSELLTRDPNVWPSDIDPELPLPNVWLGVSVEDQHWADIRIPALLDTPAAVRFLSCEPLIGPVDLDLKWLNGPDDDEHCDCANGGGCSVIDWVIVGGESGPGARPMHPDWARTIRDDCETNDVAFLFKQWGAHDAAGKRTSKHAAGRELDGRTWDEYPVTP
jgi:protein gp37